MSKLVGKKVQTSAEGMAAVVRTIVEDTGETIPYSIAIDSEYGCKNISMSVPVVLGKGGVKQILELKLTPDERELLNHSIEVLKPTMRYVEELLHLC